MMVIDGVSVRINRFLEKPEEDLTDSQLASVVFYCIQGSSLCYLSEFLSLNPQAQDRSFGHFWVCMMTSSILYLLVQNFSLFPALQDCFRLIYLCWYPGRTADFSLISLPRWLLYFIGKSISDGCLLTWCVPLQEWLINEKRLPVFGMKLPTGFQLIGQVVCPLPFVIII